MCHSLLIKTVFSIKVDGSVAVEAVEDIQNDIARFDKDKDFGFGFVDVPAVVAKPVRKIGYNSFGTRQSNRERAS